MKILLTLTLLIVAGTSSAHARVRFRPASEYCMKNSINQSIIASIRTSYNRGVTYVFEEKSSIPKYTIQRFMGHETFLLKNDDYLLERCYTYENENRSLHVYLYYQGICTDSLSWINNDGDYRHDYLDTLSQEILNYDNHHFTIDSITHRFTVIEKVGFKMKPIYDINQLVKIFHTPSFLVNGIPFEDWIKKEFRIKKAFHFSMAFTTENGQIVQMDSMFSTIRQRRKQRKFHENVFNKLRQQTITRTKGEINLPVWHYNVQFDFVPE